MNHFNLFKLKIRVPYWKFTSFLLLFCILSTYFLLHAKFSSAANAIPGPPPIDCKDVKNPEFASDRPYQGSVCGDRPITYWCGNDIVVDLGSVKVGYCDPGSGQAQSCPADITKKQKIDIDLTNVQLPFLGNTQLTKNSTSNTDQLDDGAKVSNYVAWYLGGTGDKAEYTTTDPLTVDQISKIVDTSGPIKKLLPSVLQDATRINAINNANTEVTYVPETEGDPTAPPPQSVTEPLTHNQIVACAKKTYLLGPLGQLIGLVLKAVPYDCYTNGTPPEDDLYRLKSWNETFTDDIKDTILRYISDHIPNNFVGVITKDLLMLDRWQLKTPPLPWNDGNNVPFASQMLYQKAYNEWRGQYCAIVPIFNSLICFWIPGVSNQYADLYKYVPLANTADKQGSHLITNTHLSAPKATFDCPGGVCYTILHIFGLKEPHTAEDFTLANLLQTTFKPAAPAQGNTQGITGTTIPNDVEDNSSACRILPSRTNSGDDVVFDNHPSHGEVDVQYHVSEIQCTNIHQECTRLGRGPTAPLVCGLWTANCESEVYATIDTISKTAYADEIWAKTVAGEDSIFRRIYPKNGADAPVSCIADTPASSNATYTLSGNSSPGLSLVRVIEPDQSSVGSGGSQSIDAQLYYPHFGGVAQYFLSGIQQALRPLGFGDGTPESGQLCSNIACGELPKTLPKATGSCQTGSSGRLGPLPKSLLDIIGAASQTYHTAPGLILGIMFGEGDFNKDTNGNFTRYYWSDANVKNWATCQKLPKCTGPDSSIVEFNGWDTLAKQILPDLQKIDPTKKQADPCNLIDAVYALAKNLHDNAGGSGSMTGKSCFGIPMTSTNPGSCSWDQSQLETAIRVWEIGTVYDTASNKTCLTTNALDLQSYGIGSGVGSCGTGIPNTAGPNYTDYLCRGGDLCETVGNHSTDPGFNSHNACIWDVATSVTGPQEK